MHLGAASASVDARIPAGLSAQWSISLSMAPRCVITLTKSRSTRFLPHCRGRRETNALR